MSYTVLVFIRIKYQIWKIEKKDLINKKTIIPHYVFKATTIEMFPEDAKERFLLLSTTTMVKVHSNNNGFKKNCVFVFCTLFPIRIGLREQLIPTLKMSLYLINWCLRESGTKFLNHYKELLVI